MTSATLLMLAATAWSPTRVNIDLHAITLDNAPSVSLSAWYDSDNLRQISRAEVTAAGLAVNQGDLDTLTDLDAWFQWSDLDDFGQQANGPMFNIYAQDSGLELMVEYDRGEIHWLQGQQWYYEGFDIDNWTYQAVPEPGTILAAALGLLMVIRHGLRSQQEDQTP